MFKAIKKGETAAEDATSFSFWRNGILLASSAADTIRVTEGGTYRVQAANASGCSVTASVVMNWETAPATPEIMGVKSSKPGVDQTFIVAKPASNLEYTWTVPENAGYRLASGSLNTDKQVTVTMGTVTASLQLAAKNYNGKCKAVVVSPPVEIVAAPEAVIYPTVIGSDEPITIIAKDMIIGNVSVVNTIGVPFKWDLVSGSLPSNPDEPIQISVGALPGGHYFITIYGTNGERVTQQVVKN